MSTRVLVADKVSPHEFGWPSTRAKRIPNKLDDTSCSHSLPDNVVQH